MRIKYHSNARKTPDEVSGLKVPYPPARRIPPKWRWYLILLLVFSPLIHFGVTTLYSLLMLDAQGLVYLDRYELRSTAEGYARSIKVQPGDVVKKGDVLIDLEDPSLGEKIVQLNAELNKLQQAEVLNRASPQQVLEDQVTLAQNLFDERNERLAAMQKLFDQGAATITEVTEAKDRLIDAETRLNRAKVELAAEIRRAVAQNNDSLGGSTNRVKTELQLLEYRMNQFSQRAPHDGKVLEVSVNEGEFAAKGETLLALGNQQDPSVLAFINPSESHRIEIGDEATVKLTDGSRIIATVASLPSPVEKLPKAMEHQFGFQPMSVKLKLPTEQSGSNELIYGSPVSVRFHFGWETGLKNLFSFES